MNWSPDLWLYLHLLHSSLSLLQLLSPGPLALSQTHLACYHPKAFTQAAPSTRPHVLPPDICTANSPTFSMPLITSYLFKKTYPDSLI